MIRKLPSGEYRLYSRKIYPKTGKRRNLGTFPTKEAAARHERDIHYFKRRRRVQHIRANGRVKQMACGVLAQSAP